MKYKVMVHPTQLRATPFIVSKKSSDTVWKAVGFDDKQEVCQAEMSDAMLSGFRVLGTWEICHVS